MARAVAGTTLAFALAACASATRPPAVDGQQENQVSVARTVSYGPGPDQVVDVHLPTGDGPFPTVVLLHGGFWSAAYGRDLMAPLAADLVERGHVAVNVEFRRVGGGGGWPETFEDVAAAVDLLAELDAPIDRERVSVVGHSSGGHLATWVASRPNLPPGAPGADPRVRPCATVSQSGVVSLEVAAADGVGAGAVTGLLGGGPDDVPDRYALADPMRLLPPGAPVLLVHSAADRIVPIDQSESYARAAGTSAELLVVDGDHFTVLHPNLPAWEATVDWLARTCSAR